MLNYDKERLEISSIDQECRYLPINMPEYPYNPSSAGLFGQQLKMFGIILPYGILAYDLVSSGILEPSLYVELPKNFFDSWENFPERSAKFTKLHDHDAGWYQFSSLSPDNKEDICECIHPYDWALKDTFVRKFQSKFVLPPTIHKHENGRSYIAGEVYLPFWHIYALANSYYKVRHSKSLINDKEEGKNLVLNRLRFDIVKFSGKYSEIFERISWCKTIVSMGRGHDTKFSYEDLYVLSIKLSQANQTVLKDDLVKLMRLYSEWKEQIRKHGCSVLVNACKNLALDIYYVFKQLQTLGFQQYSLFDEFENDYEYSNMEPLYEILGNEKYIFMKAFTLYAKRYCSEIKQLQVGIDDSVFNDLYEVKGFDTWVRAFNDIHKNLHEGDKPKATFNQFRIVDSLIIITIRTEIVIREMFRSILGDKKSNDTITCFLKHIKDEIDDNAKKVIDKASGKDMKKITELYNMPEEIFEQIDKITFKYWDEEQLYCFKALLKFLTARNYFAHHAYKDSEINTHPSSLAGEIMKASVVTLLFIHKHKVCLKNEKIESK